MASAPKRIANFTSSETELLALLVKKYGNILENKKNNCVSNQLKEETWQKLANEFNSASGVCDRSAKALRGKYENLKKTLKRKHVQYRRNLYGTGGGPSQAQKLTTEEETIMELSGPMIEGLESRFDGDQTLFETPPSDEGITLTMVNEIEPDEETREQEIGATTVEESQQPFTSTAHDRFVLKRKKSTPLRQRGRNGDSFNNTMKRYESLSLNKTTLIEEQIADIVYRREQDTIEHNLRCEALRNADRREEREHILRCEKAERDKIEQDLRCEALKLDIFEKKAQ